MIESAASTPELDFDAIERLVGGESWEQLSPNLPSPSDLLPSELNAKQIETVVSAFLTNPALATHHKNGDNEESAALSYDLPGVGYLERSGSWEHAHSKICYRLTTETGKKMAVLLAAYSSSLGVRIPDDPRMSEVTGYDYSIDGKHRVWEYSDLRTYLYVPIGRIDAVKFQEFGDEMTGMRSSLLVGIARTRAMRRIKQHPQSKFFYLLDENTKRELEHRRHYLTKEGHQMPAVIDIPVAERLS